ncbi:hypothetical protein L1987_15063 [Smallanthus sonchifolius]|uniref:Uncharacterized protein n=1 Tax=Smallanthus sonchifolius TaxID=185202 RepID=A0ACB9J6P9_9ASTR|nr:hypothetical protein L1987_15063 [Smallanthus sonchifolius]
MVTSLVTDEVQTYLDHRLLCIKYAQRTRYTCAVIETVICYRQNPRNSVANSAYLGFTNSGIRAVLEEILLRLPGINWLIKKEGAKEEAALYKSSIRTSQLKN